MAKELLITAKRMLFASACLMASANLAANESTIQAKEHQAIVSKIKSMTGLEVQAINPTPLNELLEVLTNQGIFYTSNDGKYLFQGKLYDIEGQGKNLTEESLAKVRLAGIEKFQKEMIVYPAKDEKHVVTIFTDITCGYCRQLHQQMDKYNDLGITVRYMAYPRAGVIDRTGNFSQGFKDLRSIWCSTDPATALTKAKQGEKVVQQECDKPLADGFDFAQQVGVNSTPAILFDNGLLLPGYRQPQDLIKVLESLKSDS